LRRISVVVVSVLLMLALAGTSTALADPPDGKGQPGATEEKEKGQPDNPNGFGTVVSQKGATTTTSASIPPLRMSRVKGWATSLATMVPLGTTRATTAASSAIWTTRSEPTPTALPMLTVIPDAQANNVIP
jgi:hypothetical protein